MEYKLCASCTQLGQPPPVGSTHARRCIACDPLSHEVHIGVLFISWPMTLEIVEEYRPVRLEPICLEVAQRKREAVIDADNRSGWLGQPGDEPFGEATPRP